MRLKLIAVCLIICIMFSMSTYAAEATVAPVVPVIETLLEYLIGGTMTIAIGQALVGDGVASNLIDTPSKLLTYLKTYYTVQIIAGVIKLHNKAQNRDLTVTIPSTKIQGAMTYAQAQANSNTAIRFYGYGVKTSADINFQTWYKDNVRQIIGPQLYQLRLTKYNQYNVKYYEWIDATEADIYKACPAELQSYYLQFVNDKNKLIFDVQMGAVDFSYTSTNATYQTWNNGIPTNPKLPLSVYPYQMVMNRGFAGYYYYYASKVPITSYKWYFNAQIGGGNLVASMYNPNSNTFDDPTPYFNAYSDRIDGYLQSNCAWVDQYYGSSYSNNAPVATSTPVYTTPTILTPEIVDNTEGEAVIFVKDKTLTVLNPTTTPTIDTTPPVTVTAENIGTSTVAVPDVNTDTGILQGIWRTLVEKLDAINESIKSVTATDEKINLEPLKTASGELTNKFPFCLPWDLLHAFQSIGNNTKQPDFSFDMMGTHIPVDISQFNPLIAFMRSMELLLVGIGLVFGTRKVIGGDV